MRLPTTLLFLTLAGSGALAAPAGVVDRFEILSTQDAYNGATPAGAAGPYVVITAIVHGRLDPAHPDNAGIVDLPLAPRDADGWVHYSTDATVLRPKRAADARRILFYDVVNRGGRLGQGVFIGGGSLTDGAAPGAEFPSLLRRGYTVVWSGWQGDIAQTGRGASAALGTRFPVATAVDGKPLTGMSREEFIPDQAGGGHMLALGYPPASPDDRSEVAFTARASWLNAKGEADYASSPSAPVTDWQYLTRPDGTVAVRFTPPAALPLAGGGTAPPDGGTIYSFVYRAAEPRVAAIGFAAVRDLLSFLKSSPADAQGRPNPLNDMKAAPCAAGKDCPTDPAGNFDVVLGEGTSQSGRFLRDFLYRGFNRAADGRPVFDGLLAIIPGARRTWTATRFAQQGRWSRQHEDHFMQGDQFPFSYTTLTDPVSGRTDGLLQRCTADNTCPKIMQIDGSFEWWGGRASLNVTDGAGHDVPLPANVRYYFVPGTQHGGGSGVTTGLVTPPATGSQCQFANSPVTMTPFERALLLAMENWVVQGAAPPPSAYPSVASGQLAAPDAASLGFFAPAALPVTIAVPGGGDGGPTSLTIAGVGRLNPLFVTDHADAVPRVQLDKPYRLLVPRLNADGNEVAGIETPEVKVPLATYLGWNLRGKGHTEGEGCSASGGVIPLAVDEASRSPADPRPPLSARYRGRADYIAKFSAATDALVARGLLLPLDAEHVLHANGARVSPRLLPRP
ncbi:alpha/beta hydrolase domain-containing protein [Roseateles sp. BYS78W]|uniref:Alpha/beta hydrolase domain-containing protein n=1 Tax=Pelomonas candidula TaxID=3299025 RepID=A0ABW7HH61_9BURK